MTVRVYDVVYVVIRTLKYHGRFHMPPVEKVDRTLDCLKLLCPVPIIKISKAVKELQAGQTLLMLADDPGSKADMLAWAKQTGNELLGIEEEGKVFKFYVRKTR